MKKLAIMLTSFGAFAILATGIVKADVKNCRPIYGGGETCIQSATFTIDKTIQDPKTKRFVDNLGVNDTKYGAGATINFALTIKNVSKNALTNIQVTDTFPQFVDFAEGNGEYDEEKRILSFSIAKLNPQESKTYMVKTKVVGKNDLPKNGASCIANLAQAQVKEDMSADNAQFCLVATGTTQPTQAPTQNKTKPQPITKGGQPVYQTPNSKTSPATGPEALALIALLPSGVAGFLLRRKYIGK